jgi:hypothetical protein
MDTTWSWAGLYPGGSCREHITPARWHAAGPTSANLDALSLPWGAFVQTCRSRFKVSPPSIVGTGFVAAGGSPPIPNRRRKPLAVVRFPREGPYESGAGTWLSSTLRMWSYPPGGRPQAQLGFTAVVSPTVCVLGPGQAQRVTTGTAALSGTGHDIDEILGMDW